MVNIPLKIRLNNLDGKQKFFALYYLFSIILLNIPPKVWLENLDRKLKFCLILKW